MNLLMKIWQQPNWIKWIIYIVIVYILFLIKEAFAVLLWVLFAFLLYLIIFVFLSSCGSSLTFLGFIFIWKGFYISYYRSFSLFSFNSNFNKVISG